MNPRVKTCKPFTDTILIQQIALICGHDLFISDPM